MTNPVRLRGIDFPSQAAAARELGISTYRVHRALNLRGDFDVDYVSPRRAKPIHYRGHVFPSQQAMARITGISQGCIWSWLKHGKDLNEISPKNELPKLISSS